MNTYRVFGQINTKSNTLEHRIKYWCVYNYNFVWKIKEHLGTHSRIYRHNCTKSKLPIIILLLTINISHTHIL